MLMEDAIRQPDLSKSVQRYQLAVDDAKVRLGLCSLSCGLVNALAHAYQHSEHGWLQQSAQASDARYKAQSRQQHKCKHKKAAVRPMDGGVSKVNSPNSHPSNLIHKEAVKAQGLGEPSKQAAPAP